MSTNELLLGVYRNLQNRTLGEPDDGPIAQEAHEKRRLALEEILAQPGIVVLDWGDTKDKASHEFVELAISVVSSPMLHSAVVPAAAFLGGVLAETLKSTLVDGIKYLFANLVSKVRRREIQDFSITLPNGIRINVDPDCEVRYSQSDGKTATFNFDNPPK